MTFFEILTSLSVSLIQSPNNSSKSAINLVDKGLYATMNRWCIAPSCESRMTKNGTTRHEKALLIDFIRYQRKETKQFIRCRRIKISNPNTSLLENLCAITLYKKNDKGLYATMKRWILKIFRKFL